MEIPHLSSGVGSVGPLALWGWLLTSDRCQAVLQGAKISWHTQTGGERPPRGSLKGLSTGLPEPSGFQSRAVQLYVRLDMWVAVVFQGPRGILQPWSALPLQVGVGWTAPAVLPRGSPAAGLTSEREVGHVGRLW